MRRRRKQCAKCPWKVSTDPTTIPHGYCAKAHAALSATIARPDELRFGPVRIMACHETPHGRELPCVGWLVHQMGVGNNIGLRLAALKGRVDANVRTVGRQHVRFEDTLPREAS